MLSINTKSKPFGDKRVRQAMSYLLDRKRAVDRLGFGFTTRLVLPWPPSSPAYRKDQNDQQQFDAKTAAQLLSAAGVGPGFSPKFFLAYDAWPLWVQMAQIFKSDAATIGVNVDIQQLTNAQFLQEAAPAAQGKGLLSDIGTYNLANIDMHPAFPFYMTVYYRTSPPNWSAYDSPQYRALIAKLGDPDANTRKQAYTDMNALLLDEAFTYPLMSRNLPVVLRSNVRGFEIGRNGITYLRDTTVKV